MQPSRVYRVNFQKGIFAMPAGSEMNVRTMGSMRLKKTDGRAVPVEPALRQLQVMVAEQDVLAVLVDEGPAAVEADRVGDPGADDVARHPGDGDAEQGHGALAHGEAGEGHDRLARHRDAGALQQHQEEDRRQAPVADEGGGPLDDRVDDGLHHARQRTVLGAGRASSAAPPVARSRSPVVGSELDFPRRKEALHMAVGLMDIKGQYAELQDRIEDAVL